MGNGQLKAGYNVQIGTENQFVIASTLHRRAGDTACMIPHLESAKKSFGILPLILTADAGYGSEENYAHLESNDVRAFVKYNMFHKEQKRFFKKDSTQPKNWVFDKETDEWICAQNRKLSFLYEKKERSDLGYESHVSTYRCEDCTGCPHQKKCTRCDDESRNRIIYVSPLRDACRRRAERRLASAEGMILRHRRATDVETVFGDIKHNHGFKRFTLRGLEKVTLEWELVALGHNMRKLFKAMTGNSASRLSGRPA